MEETSTVAGMQGVSWLTSVRSVTVEVLVWRTEMGQEMERAELDVVRPGMTAPEGMLMSLTEEDIVKRARTGGLAVD
jgi:hypothetical protein